MVLTVMRCMKGLIVANVCAIAVSALASGPCIARWESIGSTDTVFYFSPSPYLPYKHYYWLVATLSAICAYSSALVGIVFCPPFSFGVKRWGGILPPHPCDYGVYWSKSGYSSNWAKSSSVIAQSFVRALSVSSLSSVSSGDSSPHISRRLSINPVRLPVL